MQLQSYVNSAFYS